EYFGESSSIGNRINRITVFKDGSVWIGTNHGLSRYNPNTNDFETYLNQKGNDHSLNSNIVYDIIETQKGDIYIAAEANDIQQFFPERRKFTSISYTRNSSLDDNYRKRIVEDAQGVLWISANHHGLCSYNPSTKESKLYCAENQNLSTNVLMGDMAFDANGFLWICTEGQGINVFNPQRETYYSIKNDNSLDGGLGSNHVYTIFFDDDQIAWVGTFDKGVSYYNPSQNKFQSPLFQPNDNFFVKQVSVLSVFEDSKGQIWLGTDGNGVYQFTKGKPPAHFQSNSVNFKEILLSNVITCINEDIQGNILLGTYTGGLVSLNPMNLKVKGYLPITNSKKSLHAVNVWCIKKDSKRRIWLGLLGNGVDEYLPEKEQFINYGPNSTQNNKIDFPNVMAIMEDDEGDVWFGTEGKGVFVLDSQTDKVFQFPTDSVFRVLEQGIIKCLFQDRWGFIWLGTEDMGLFKFDKKSYQIEKIPVGEDDLSGSIQSLMDDNYGNLWIGTSNGLYRYFYKGQVFERYVVQDGLSDNEFNPGSVCKLRDGRIAFGSKNGIDIIDPLEISQNQVIPKVVFTKLSVLNKEVNPGQILNNRVMLNKSISFTNEVTLEYFEKVFTIEFAALNYTLPEKCRYQYMLVNFDNDWINTSSNRRFASYSNLDPGQYVFKVRASNNDGKWGNNIAPLKITITPPFWMTWWFVTICGILMVTVLIAFYKYRIQVHKDHFRQQQLEQEKKIFELENEKLETELKQLAFQTMHRKKLLLEQRTKLEWLSTKAKVSVSEGLQKIIQSIDEELNDEKDWKYVEPQLDKVYNSFISRLIEKHSDLTASEIKIAAYIRMNLTTKEISEYMHKTARAIENDRYRLRKKLGLELNDSLQNYLMNF
ncbi:MAG: hypothetical protein M0P66_03775, partial [Salinivirgaceae bacterium]|nr:hypothetical protein [Salinivirgaceae bacterium]